MAGVLERELVVDGVRSPVLEAGAEGAAEAAVFVHGNPGSSEDWRDLVGRAGEHGRAIAFDMPGFGRAGKPRDFDHTVTGHAAHLEAALAELGVARAHLVLHDFGGPWGLAWAAGAPDAVGSVTLIDTGVLFDYRWHRMARIWRTPLVGELAMAMTTRRAWRRGVRLGGGPPLPREFTDRIGAEYDWRTRRAVLRLYRATDHPGEVSTFLAGLLKPLADRPALVIWGARDPYLPVRLAERQREVFTDAEVHALPDSGHWPFADDPEGVASLVVPFLAGRLSAS